MRSTNDALRCTRAARKCVSPGQELVHAEPCSTGTRLRSRTVAEPQRWCAKRSPVVHVVDPMLEPLAACKVPLDSRKSKPAALRLICWIQRVDARETRKIEPTDTINKAIQQRAVLRRIAWCRSHCQQQTRRRRRRISKRLPARGELSGRTDDRNPWMCKGT